MKESYYFSHDYNPRSDVKIKKLLLHLGMKGYGLFWAIVEELYNNANALPTDYECIAFDMRCEPDDVKTVVEKFGLFELNDGIFSSNSVKRRLDERSEKSEKAKKSAAARWGNDANAMRTQCERNAIKERKGKEIKGNEKKEEIETNDFYFERFKNDFTQTESIAISIGLHASFLQQAKNDFMTLVRFAEPKPNYREFLNHFTNWAKKNVAQYKLPPR